MQSLALLIDKIIDNLYLDCDCERDHELAGRFWRGQYPQSVYPVRVDFLYRITEPLLRPLRRVLPNLGGVDISPGHPAARPFLPAQPVVGVSLACSAALTLPRTSPLPAIRPSCVARPGE